MYLVTFHYCKAEAQAHFAVIYNMDLGQRKRRREVIIKRGKRENTRRDISSRERVDEEIRLKNREDCNSVKYTDCDEQVKGDDVRKRRGRPL